MSAFVAQFTKEGDDYPRFKQTVNVDTDFLYPDCEYALIELFWAVLGMAGIDDEHSELSAKIVKDAMCFIKTYALHSDNNHLSESPYFRRNYGLKGGTLWLTPAEFKKGRDCTKEAVETYDLPKSWKQQ